MPQTRPTGDQLRFQSSKTGEHVLDDYLERAERGTRTLSNLLDDLWEPGDGALRADLWDLRVNPSTFELQQRIGTFQNAEDGWTNVENASFFNYRGTYADATAYKRLDLVIHSGEFFLCTAPHTSSGPAPSGTNFKPLITLLDAGVATFNGRSGTVLLSSADVTTALGYTPVSPASQTSALASYLPLAGGTVTNNLTVRSAPGFGSVVLRPSSDTSPGALDFVDGSGASLGSVGGVPGANSRTLAFQVFGDGASINFNTIPLVNSTPLALSGHTHAISDIVNLQATLNAKSNTDHTHAYLPLAGGTLTGNLTISKAAPQLSLSGADPTLRLLGNNTTAVTTLEWHGNVGGVSTLQATAFTVAQTRTLQFTSEAFVFSNLANTSQYARIDSSGLTVLGRNILSDIDGKAPTVHTHAISSVTNLQSTLDGKLNISGGTLTGPLTVFGNNNRIQLTTDGGIEIMRAAANGDGPYIDFKDSDAEDFDVRIQVTGSTLSLAAGTVLINGAVPSLVGHAHAISDITNLQTTLDGKANAEHTHVIANVTGLQGALGGKANAFHTHPIADITNLQPTLNTMQSSIDGKASASHTHTIADITGLQAALDSKPTLSGSDLPIAGMVTADGIELGYRSLPLTNNLVSGTTATTAIRGKGYYASQPVTVPANTFAKGDMFTVAATSVGTVSIVQGSGLTLRLAGTSLTGDRTITPNGIATILFVSATEALISGPGVS